MSKSKSKAKKSDKSCTFVLYDRGSSGRFEVMLKYANGMEVPVTESHSGRRKAIERLANMVHAIRAMPKTVPLEIRDSNGNLVDLS